MQQSSRRSGVGQSSFQWSLSGRSDAAFAAAAAAAAAATADCTRASSSSSSARTAAV